MQQLNFPFMFCEKGAILIRQRKELLLHNSANAQKGTVCIRALGNGNAVLLGHTGCQDFQCQAGRTVDVAIGQTAVPLLLSGEILDDLPQGIREHKSCKSPVKCAKSGFFMPHNSWPSFLSQCIF